MLTSKKPPRCKECGIRTDKPGRLLHDECVPAWWARVKAKQERDRKAKAKLERVEIRKRKEAIKTIPVLIAEAQKEFNAYIRLRDAGKPCICCGKPLGDGDVGGGYDCGHYRSTGSAAHLRFDERNAHAQRKQCNRWGAGRAVDYRIGLVARIGLDAVEALEADNKPHKWTADELRAIRATYKAKHKALIAGKETA